MNDKLRVLLALNAQKLAYILINFPTTYAQMFKDEFDLTPEESKSLHTEWYYTKFKGVLPKKVIRRTKSLIDRLRENEIMVDKENLSITIPAGTKLTQENMDDIDKLHTYGYTTIHATIPQGKLFE